MLPRRCTFERADPLILIFEKCSQEWNISKSRLNGFPECSKTCFVVLKCTLQAGGIIERVSILEITELLSSRFCFFVPTCIMQQQGMVNPIALIVGKKL